MDRMAHDFDDIFSFYGEPIGSGGPVALHSFEDRFTITAPEFRQRVKGQILELAAGRMLPPDRGYLPFIPGVFDIARWQELGTVRRFLQTQKKCGLFVESACVVTDGCESDPSQILVARPCATGFERPPARLVFASSSVRFDRLKQTPHACASVIGERLLLPVDAYESRLAAIAYDFTQADSDVLRLVWHVRVADRALAAHIPSCDLPFCGADCKGPFRQASLSWLPLGQLADSVHAINPHELNAYEAALASPVGFTTQERTDIASLAMRLYQQQAHAGLRSLSGGMSISDFIADVRAFLKVTDIGNRLLVHETKDDMVPLILESPRTQAMVGLSFAIQDSVVVGESHAEALSEWYETSPLAVSLTGLALICGIRQARPYVCHNPLTLWHSPLPVEVIRVVVNPRSSKLATRGVAHAVIAFDRRGANDWKVVVTRQRHDESARLPGGKLEFGETPEQAVLRECNEELGLDPDDFTVLKPIPMQPAVWDSTSTKQPAARVPLGECCSETTSPTRAINEYATRLVSPKTGELTCYLLYPFWAELTESGQEKILSKLGQPKHYPRLIDSKFWCETGLGYDCEYPRRICENLTEFL